MIIVVDTGWIDSALMVDTASIVNSMIDIS